MSNPHMRGEKLNKPNRKREKGGVCVLLVGHMQAAFQ